MPNWVWEYKMWFEGWRKWKGQSKHILVRSALAPLVQRLRSAWRSISSQIVAYWKSVLLLSYLALVGPVGFKIYAGTLLGEEVAVAEVQQGLIALTGIIALPLLSWRSYVAWEQVENSRLSRLSEMFSKAVEKLSAEKQSSNPEFAQPKPDIMARAAAIMTLEKIVKETDEDYFHVVQMLASYVRENSPLQNPLPTISLEYVEDVSRFRTAEIFGALVQEVANATDEPREDIQTAIDVLGRRPHKMRRVEQERRYRVDLSRSNLRKIKFSRWYNDEIGATRGNFRDVDFSQSALDFAQMASVDFSGAEFAGTSLVGVNAVCAIFSKAILSDVVAHAANFNLADMRSAEIMFLMASYLKFKEVNLDGGSISESKCFGLTANFSTFNRSLIYGNDFRCASFDRCKVSRALFADNDLTCSTLFDFSFTASKEENARNPQSFEGAIGDASTVLEEYQSRPASWPTSELDLVEREELKKKMRAKLLY